MKQWYILLRIRDYGGVTGQVAGLYLGDVEKGKGYICEIAEQCHIDYVHEVWDEVLISDIKEFANEQKNNHEKNSRKSKGDFGVSE